METLEHDDAQSVRSDLSTSNYHVGLKEDLLAALQSIQTSGSFASFNALRDAPPAGLFVQDVGDISMPLNETQAGQLIAKARQAPYGRGSDTIVDTSVRNTWELDADQFDFRDLGWPTFLQRVCTRVSRELGINAPIRAELYKMLIYEEGAMFKAHTDTEKIPGMFGTLVICLPSAHEGGEVVVKHCGEKKVFKTSNATQSYACWYSDVSHEVLPVTSGYRWVLTFNLAIDPAQVRPSAGLQRSETRQLRHTLRRWLEESEGPQKRDSTFHVLDHEYTEASVSLAALKTRDLAQVQTLKEISRELPISIFLALLEKEEIGDCVWEPNGYGRYGYYDEEDEVQDRSGLHHLEEVYERTYRVKTLVDLRGRMVSSNELPLDKDGILVRNCFDDVEAEEEYEGYMGNSGPSATHWYRVTAVVIVPHNALASFFTSRKHGGDYYSSTSDRSEQIGYLARLCFQQDTPESLFDAMVDFCNEVWEDSPQQTTSFGAPSRQIDGPTLQAVLKAALCRRRYAFFNEAAAKHDGLLAPDYFTWIQKWLSTGDNDHVEQFNMIKRGLSSAVAAYPYFAVKFKAVTTLIPLPQQNSESSPEPLHEELLEWARQTLITGLTASVSRSLSKMDGSAMAEASMYFTNPSDFLSQTVVPMIVQKSDAAAFYLAFLAELRFLDAIERLPGESTLHTFWTIARSFHRCTDFAQLRGDGVSTEARNNRANKRARYDEATVMDRTSLVTNALSGIFLSLFEMNTGEADEFAATLASKIIADTPRIPANQLNLLWLPFLRDLASTMISTDTDRDTPIFQQLYTTLLNAYLTTYVRQEPVRDRSLYRRPVSCSCGDCSELNRFLENPREGNGRFPLNEGRRAHLAGRINAAGIDCTHKTEKRGSPYSLVVVKSFRQNEQEIRDWKARQKEAAAQFKKFEWDDLEVLLGPNYSSIVNMNQIRLTPVAHRPAPTTQGPAASSATVSVAGQSRGALRQMASSNSSLPPAAGVKRSMPSGFEEIIDLTGD